MITLTFKLIGFFFASLWLADFLTGFFHWIEDTYCLENFPLIGGFICEPNIDHHIDPQLMVRTGNFISRNSFQWGLGAGIFGVLWLVGLGTPFAFVTVVLASFGNEVHRWNHMSKTNRFVTFMKDSGLIQMQRQHSLHHKQPHNQYYCVLTSQMNSVLERISFWRRLEWFVQVTTGITPKRDNRRDSPDQIKEARKVLANKSRVQPHSVDSFNLTK